MKKLFLISAVILGFLTFFSCEGEEQQHTASSDFSLLVDLPSSLEVEEGKLLSFGFFSGKGPMKGDRIVFKKDGIEYVSVVESVSSDSFCFALPKDISSGTYDFIVRRESVSKSLGRITLSVIKKVDVVIDDDSTIYGFVRCEAKGLAGVQVSDGYEIVVTDADGFYQMNSKKKNKMVYITIPSGYMPKCLGVQALFFHVLEKAETVAERKDFELFKTADQTDHTMLFFGDMHLANRSTKDRSQFSNFTKEVAAYVGANGSKPIYAMTLGDMTWDVYWYDNNYSFTNYLSDINQNINCLTVFHTMGNHDHDMRTSINGSSAGWDAVDWDTAHLFRDVLGPNYYSFNVGDVHYISLDDIYCKNTTGGKSADRKYDETVGAYVLDWLKKDLSYVDKSKTVVVAMHAPVFNQSGSEALKSAKSLTDCFSGFSNVLFVTGHSHKLWTVDKGSFKEHNTGAVCAAWWWSGYYVPELNIAQDGGPGGYRIMDFSGGNYTSFYKATGRPEAYQFRSYDRNQIKIDPTKVKYSAEYEAYLKQYGGYNEASSANQVILNVWDWNSKWKVEVTENGKPLTVTQFSGYDPLYFLTYCEGRFGSTTAPSFDVFKTIHMFKCTASSVTSTLQIKVTDDEGRVYTETMTRPKPFSLSTYK